MVPLAAAVMAAVGLASLSACTPALDWRDVRPAGSGAVLLMPCKPQRLQRQVTLAGQPTRLTLHACTADDLTWGLAFADIADPARMGDVLQALVQAALANVAAGAQREATPHKLALQVRGATPHDASRRLAYQGRLPDGRAVQMQMAVFAHGTRAFQATAFGSALPAQDVQTFMESIRFGD